MYNTPTRVGADITSLLGMKTTTELCRQKYTDVYRQVVAIRREYTSGDWGAGGR